MDSLKHHPLDIMKDRGTGKLPFTHSDFIQKQFYSMNYKTKAANFEMKLAA